MKQRDYKHPHAGLIWYWDGSTWQVDAVLARSVPEVRGCIELMTQRAALRAPENAHVCSTWLDTAQLDGGMLTRADRLPTCMEHLRRDTLFRAALRALKPWLAEALGDKFTSLHFGTWADRQKGGAA